jgi:hypothetical protein
MLWLAAVAMTVPTAPSAPLSGQAVTVTARAMIRIVSGVRLKLDAERNADAPSPRQTIVMSDGAARPARLIEFE